MAIGKIEHVTKSEFNLRGLKLKCIDCMYGNPYDCPTGVTKICGEYLGWLPDWKYQITSMLRNIKIGLDKINFFEIIDDKDYYENDKNIIGNDVRWYVLCDTCGYIPYDYNHSQTQSCINNGHVIYSVDYSELEILEIKEQRKYADWMTDTFMLD